MKNTILIFVLVLSKLTFSQQYGQSELIFENNSNRIINVSFYPISMVFRGPLPPEGPPLMILEAILQCFIVIIIIVGMII